MKHLIMLYNSLAAIQHVKIILRIQFKHLLSSPLTHVSDVRS